jgi:hypothetical protein
MLRWPFWEKIMMQVWIDYDFWRLFKDWPGTIAGHVRVALRVYVLLSNHLEPGVDLETAVREKFGIVDSDAL